MNATLPTYRELLAQELERRRGRNKSYSLRAFSRDIGLSPASLSQILRGIRALSEERAHILLSHLSWSSRRKRLFLQLMQMEGMPTGAEREEMAAEIARSFPKEVTIRPLKEDVFSAFADWHHSALLASASCTNFDPQPQAVARRLGIPIEQAASAIARLKRLGLLVENQGRLVAQSPNVSLVPEVPSAAVREYHRQVLDRAAHALEKQPMDEREYMGLTISLNPTILPEVKRRIREFFHEMIALAEGTPEHTAVYHLALQCFRAEKKKT